jgi:ankyrin repeat protein
MYINMTWHITQVLQFFVRSKMNHTKTFIFALLLSSLCSHLLPSSIIDDEKSKTQTPSASGNAFQWPYHKEMIQKFDVETLKSNQHLWAENQDVDQKMDPTGRTALMFAARYNDQEFVKVLLYARANINKADKKGRTALHVALWYDNFDLAKHLVKYYGALNIANNKGIMPAQIPDKKLEKNKKQYTREQQKKIVKIKAAIQKRDAPPKKRWFRWGSTSSKNIT